MIRFLAQYARRGRSHHELAVLLYAAGHPVDADTVVGGMRTVLQSVRRDFDRLAAKAAAEASAVEREWMLSDAYERAEALAELIVDQPRGLAATIRRQLRSAHQPADRGDVLTVLVSLFRTVLGEPPPKTDEYGLDQLLYAFGAHGMVEPVYPGGPVAAPDGPASFGDALARFAGPDAFEVPTDITGAELAAARSQAQTVGTVFAAIPEGPARHHLGGDHLRSFWMPTDPTRVSQVLVSFVKISRTVALQVEEVAEAVRAQGWL